MAKIIIGNINKLNKDDCDLLQAIRLLESTGAGLTEREITYAKTHDELKGIKFSEISGRNDGLIAISKDEINQTRTWQEYALYIYFDEERMSFKVFSKQSRWDYEKDNEDENMIKFDNLEKIDINFDDIKFSEINSFATLINERLEEPFVTFIDPWDVIDLIY